MKRFLILLLAPAVILAGCGKDSDDKADQKSAPKDSDDVKATPPSGYSSQTDSNGNTVVSLTAETQKRIGLETAPVTATEAPAQATAFGTVLDPAPLVTLQGELVSDEATEESTHKVAERERALYAADQTTSQKNVQAAETDEASADVKIQTARQSLRLGWGDAIAKLSESDRQKFVADLVARNVALARVDLPIGQMLTNLPEKAEISPVGQERWFEARPMSFASSVDPRTLGLGIILQVDHPDPLLAPGGPVRARLPISGPPTRGVVVPESAIVRFNGFPWVYTPDGETNFVRREISLDTPTAGGWLVTNGLAEGAKVVTVGGATLLSEEQKASAPAAD